MPTKRVQRIPVKYRKEVEASLRYLSKAILDSREALGLTQEALSEKLGIGTTTLQSIEQQRRYPSLPMLLYILSYLKINFRIES